MLIIAFITLSADIHNILELIKGIIPIRINIPNLDRLH